MTFETKRRRKFQRQAWTINVSNTKKDKFGLETLRQLGGRNRARQGKTRVKGTNGAKEEGQHKGGNGNQQVNYCIGPIAFEIHKDKNTERQTETSK